jgi:ADP-heptose:LPS heptosyltransferase
MSAPARVLIVRLSSLGDILLATPVIDRVRAAWPGAHITFLVDLGYADLVRTHPGVDRVVQFDAQGAHRGPGGIAALAESLRPVDLVIDLQHKVRSVLLSLMLRPSRRLQLVKRNTPETIRALLGRDTILRGPHQIERYLAVLEGEVPPPPEGFCARPSLRLDPGWQEQAQRRLPPAEVPYAALVLGARHRTKLWPARHWEALCRRLLERGVRPVLIGDPAHGVPAGAVAGRIGRNLPIIEDGSLGELAGVLGRCRVVVSPDSGPAHMAAALGIPVVALFGPTSPERWAPLGERVAVLSLALACSPCSNHGSAACPLGTQECLEALSPERVAGEALRLVHAAGEGP